RMEATGLQECAPIRRAQISLTQVLEERVGARGPVNGFDRGNALVGKAITIGQRPNAVPPRHQALRLELEEDGPERMIIRDRPVDDVAVVELPQNEVRRRARSRIRELHPADATGLRRAVVASRRTIYRS